MHYLHCTTPGCKSVLAVSDKPFAEHSGMVLCKGCAASFVAIVEATGISKKADSPWDLVCRSIRRNFLNGSDGMYEYLNSVLVQLRQLQATIPVKLSDTSKKLSQSNKILLDIDIEL